jgi:glycosyltransferase involved in cell wall biosynthesis
MKVLEVSPSFFPARQHGGVTESTWQLTRHLGRLGCKMRVLTTDAGANGSTFGVLRDRELSMDQGVTVHYCRRWVRRSVAPDLVRRLPREAAWADVVHLNAVYSFPTIPTLATSAWLGKGVVWSPRGALQRWSGSRNLWLKRVWERICLGVRPGRLVLHVTSEQERRESLGRLPGCEAVVVPNGVELPDRVDHAPGGDRLRLLYLGRLDAKKGLENLFDACALLKQQGGLDWSLTVAGDGERSYVDSLRRRIVNAGVEAEVSSVGWVTSAGKSRLFGLADVLVLPSHTENFGNVVAEALAHGVPVIASHGTPWEQVERIGCGLWVDNSPESLAAAIRHVAGLPLQEWGARGRAWMEREFAWPAVAKRLLEVYRGLVSPGRAPLQPSREQEAFR